MEMRISDKNLVNDLKWRCRGIENDLWMRQPLDLYTVEYVNQRLCSRIYSEYDHRQALL